MKAVGGNSGKFELCTDRVIPTVWVISQNILQSSGFQTIQTVIIFFRQFLSRWWYFVTNYENLDYL